MDDGSESDPAPAVMSASSDLMVSDVAAFWRGRPKEDALSEVQWRGAFLGACEHEGRSVFAIQYEVHQSTALDEGVCVTAIFIDEKFDKFVRYQSGTELGIQQDDPAGVYYKIPVRRRLDDCRWLIRHARQQPLHVSGLKEQLAQTVRPPEARSEAFDLGADERRNAELRDQFNAARLKIGMAPDNVRAVLHAAPLEAGTAGTDTYEIYGSNEILNHLREPPFRNYSNILVLYRDGKAHVILPVLIDSGLDYKWRRSLAQWFIDLPSPP